MLKYLITFAVILISNICFLKFWYFTYKCRPIGWMAGDITAARKEGRKEVESEYKEELNRQNIKHKNEIFRITVKHNAEIRKYEDKIDRQNKKMKEVDYREIQTENKAVIVDDVVNRVNNSIKKMSSFMNEIQGEFATIKHDSNKTENINKIVCDVKNYTDPDANGLLLHDESLLDNDEIEKIKDENQ